MSHTWMFCVRHIYIVWNYRQRNWSIEMESFLVANEQLYNISSYSKFSYRAVKVWPHWWINKVWRMSYSIWHHRNLYLGCLLEKKMPSHKGETWAVGNRKHNINSFSPISIRRQMLLIWWADMESNHSVDRNSHWEWRKQSPRLQWTNRAVYWRIIRH